MGCCLSGRMVASGTTASFSEVRQSNQILSQHFWTGYPPTARKGELPSHEEFAQRASVHRTYALTANIALERELRSFHPLYIQAAATAEVGTQRRIPGSIRKRLPSLTAVA